MLETGEPGLGCVLGQRAVPLVDPDGIAANRHEERALGVAEREQYPIGEPMRGPRGRLGRVERRIPSLGKHDPEARRELEQTRTGCLDVGRLEEVEQRRSERRLVEAQKPFAHEVTFAPIGAGESWAARRGRHAPKVSRSSRRARSHVRSLTTSARDAKARFGAGTTVVTTKRTNEDEHAGLVRSIALKLRAQFDLREELDDLVGAGNVGLVEARARFDPTRGVTFSSFAYYRIRGAIIDHVRKSSVLSRRAYEHLKQAEAMDRVAEQAGEDRAADPVGRGDPESTARALEDTLGRLTAAFVIACVGQDENESGETPEASALGMEANLRLRAAVDGLPERERALVVGHYFEGRRFDEVAAELGVSKSWASRMHTKALERLRARIEADDSG